MLPMLPSSNFADLVNYLHHLSMQSTIYMSHTVTAHIVSFRIVYITNYSLQYMLGQFAVYVRLSVYMPRLNSQTDKGVLSKL